MPFKPSIYDVPPTGPVHATDSALLSLYLSTGSESAFTELVRRHVSLVYGIALRRLGDKHLAEDVAQQVFLVLARKGQSLRGETVLGAWLVTVAHYEASDAARREKRRRERERAAMKETKTTQVDLTDDEQDEHRQAIDGALARLSGGVRRAVVLRYLYGMNNRDAAAALGISENTCKQRVFRGLERMRAVLQSKGYGTSATALEVVLPSLAASNSAAIHLVSKITAGVHAASAVTATKGALVIMATTKMKVVVAAAAVLFLGTVVVVRSHSQSPAAVPPVSAATPDPTAKAPGASQASGAARVTGAALNPVGGEARRREITTSDGKQMTVVGRGAAPADRLERSYQFVGMVDPEVNAKAQATSANRLRDGVKRLLANPELAQKLQVSTDQINRLRPAMSVGASSTPNGGGAKDADQRFVSRVHAILTPEQIQAIYSAYAADQLKGAR